MKKQNAWVQIRYDALGFILPNYSPYTFNPKVEWEKDSALRRALRDAAEFVSDGIWENCTIVEI